MKKKNLVEDFIYNALLNEVININRAIPKGFNTPLAGAGIVNSYQQSDPRNTTLNDFAKYKVFLGKNDARSKFMLTQGAKLAGMDVAAFVQSLNRLR